MQNVNLSKDDNFHESWIIREVFQHSTISNASEELAFLNPPVVNSEEELYYRGNTAVHSTGLTEESHEKASSMICYTSERPIQFAFLCSKNFLDASHKPENKPTKRGEVEEIQGVGVFDTISLQVFASTGENLVAAIETPISKFWITKLCILLEKEASSTSIEGQALPMPRLFSLTHPLDDMFPILYKCNSSINYITESEHKVRINCDTCQNTLN